MGHIRTGSQGKVLPHHPARAAASRIRDAAVGAACGCRVKSTPSGEMKFGRSLRSAFWRGRVEEEVDTELEFHVEMRARELVNRGMHPAQARDAAIRRFGNIDKVNATCRDIGRRRYRDM